VAETTVKILLCCGFRRTGKAMGQVYQCWWICREINVFSRFKYHIFYVLYQFVTYLLTHSILLHDKMLQMKDKSLISKSRNMGLEPLSFSNYRLRLCDRVNSCYKCVI
jgi:hypothetical protein